MDDLKLLKGSNKDYDWDTFDPELYRKENFSKIDPWDEEILEDLVEFYRKNKPNGRFLEVGAGPNLYPILAVLPYADNIDIWEYGAKNVRYLKSQCNQLEPDWQIWINKLRQLDPETYGTFDFQQGLRKKISIVQRSMFELPKEEYNNISMNSVAESITGRMREFQQAVYKFKDAGKPGALVAASFMAHSQGYDTAGRSFPSVCIEAWDVVKLLGPAMNSLSYGYTKTELRPGVPILKIAGQLR